MRRVRIVVACGSGVATSMLVAVKLRNIMEDRMLDVSVDTCNMNELPDRVSQYDIIVSNAQIVDDPGKPVYSGVPLLTGIGEEAVIEQVVAKVKEAGGVLE